MWPYWMMFLAPAGAALVDRSSLGFGASESRTQKVGLAWIGVFVCLTLVIGYRFEVGGDWQEYFGYLFGVTGLDVTGVLAMPDPAYQLLNWISSEFGWGIYGVNLIGGAIFIWGLLTFCRRQPQPWLGLAVAVPYLVIVVGMGYSRQAIALGLAMLGLVALSDRSNLKFVFWVALAATFHKSAVLLLPLAALASSRNRYWTMAWVAGFAALLYYLLLASDVESLYANYVEADYQSQGALIRVVMNVLPAVILLIWRGRFGFADTEARLWIWLAIVSLGLLVILFGTSASTAVDRVALYMLPLQVVVFARMPTALGQNVNRSTANKKFVDFARVKSKGRDNVPLITAAILLYYAAVQFVWLNYAQTAFAWVPYRFYPLE